MKKNIAKVLALVFVLSFAVIYSPAPFKADVVSAATGETTPTTPTSPVKTNPTTTAPAATTQTISGADKVYVVVRGDTLSKIAQKFKLTLAQLLALNPQIKNPRLIYAGQKIIVGKLQNTASTAATMKVYQGLGHTVAFRNGPGKDSEEVPVYSFTLVMADVTFDAQGKILNAYLDAYEVATPNYDGASMPHFTGWPGQEYNETNHETEKVSGKKTSTLESATAEVNGWQTKRQRGDSYGMNANNEWYKQMDFYQKWFVGKTVDELYAWFNKNTTSAGRPIKANTTNVDDLTKLSKMTDAEKAQLADVVSGATMSLSDAHGDFLGAIADAYKNRVEVTVPVK